MLYILCIIVVIWFYLIIYFILNKLFPNVNSERYDTMKLDAFFAPIMKWIYKSRNFLAQHFAIKIFIWIVIVVINIVAYCLTDNHSKAIFYLFAFLFDCSAVIIFL